jgi:hypothetical protein
MSKATAVAELETLSNVSNGGGESIGFSEPYVVMIEAEGTSDMLFHRWNNEAVETKSKAAKNSKAKKTDDIESYVYRMPENNHISIPGEYFRQSLIHAAKFRQDPRSPRKSAMDLFKAGVVALTQLADTGNKDWDYLDRRRVVIQRNAVTRVRPALVTGWSVKFELMISLAEYIDVHSLIETLTQAGRLIGVGDFRPTFGRYCIKSWKVQA